MTTPQSSSSVLAADDPPPVSRFNLAGTSPFLLTGDHAGCAIGSQLHDLGLPEAELTRHIGWDLGVAGLGRALSTRLDAPFIAQVYSRLLIDCNRDPGREDAIPEVSDGTLIPGNIGLDDRARAARVAAVHAPYHDSVASCLDERAASSRPTIMIALHSFTPIFGGVARPWHIGVLHDEGETCFARAVLERLRGDPDLVVGDNQPYRMDATDYSVRRHCLPRAIPYLELEIRQDLLVAADRQQAWAERLAGVFVDALAALDLHGL